MNIHRIYQFFFPYFRSKRLRQLKKLIPIVSTSRILDVGGYSSFWDSGQVNCEVVLLNLHLPAGQNRPAIRADGAELPFGDSTFDLVFSNSVIEHLSTFEKQQRFAAEASRVGRRIWIQTPARSFFLEPHLLTPLIHYFPRSWQRSMLRYGTVWGWLTKPDRKGVESFLAEVRLLSLCEMRELFPDCTILRERFLGMTKSYIAVKW